MKFLVITKTPPTRGLLGTIPGTITTKEVEYDDLDCVQNGLQVPIGGECLVVDMKHVTTLKARVVNEVV